METDIGAARFYRRVLHVLNDASVPYLIGGGYAFTRYTGIDRPLKDFDIFIRPEECSHVIDVLSQAGFPSQMVFPHWLAKSFGGDLYVDIIFSSGNGVARVDVGWFQHAIPGEVLGIPTKFCPVEETIWSKSFIMERERYDGADVAHLFRHCGNDLDWARLLDRFGDHWPVLFSHLVLCSFIYPDQRRLIPSWVAEKMSNRWRQEQSSSVPPTGICRGTLLSREQFRADIESGASKDARLRPWGHMTQQEVDQWTAAIEQTSETPLSPVGLWR